MPSVKPPRRRKLTPEQVVALSEVEYIERKLIDLETQLVQAGAAGSHQAFVNGTRIAVTMRRELDALRRAAALPVADEDAELTDDELVVRYRDGLAELPLPLLDQLLASVGAARLPPELRVLPGGA